MTTSEPIPPNDNEEERRQQMLDALTDAVQDEDIDFFSEIAGQQTSLRPFELAEYLDVKRRHAEDPVEKRRWGDALRAYLSQLEGQEFPAEEAEVLIAIRETIAYEEAADIAGSTEDDPSFDELFENAEEDEERLVDEDANNWEQDEFKIYMDPETYDRVSQLPVFKEAENLARGNGLIPADLGGATKHVQQLVQGDLAYHMRTILDFYVFIEAERKAAGNGLIPADLTQAHDTIEQFGSDDEVKARMKSALDKYVYKIADGLASSNGLIPADFNRARQIIEQYSSNISRRDAMLRRLGYI